MGFWSKISDGIHTWTDWFPSPLTPILSQDSVSEEEPVPFQSVSLVNGVSAETFRSTSGYHVRVVSDKTLRIKGVKGGLGVFRVMATRAGPESAFKLTESSEMKFTVSENDGKTLVDLEFERVMPCEGYINDYSLGFVVAPAIKLNVAHRRDIVLMFLEPPAVEYGMTPGKSDFAVAFGRARATASLTGNGRLHGSLDCSGDGFEWARLVVIRSPLNKKIPQVPYIVGYPRADILRELKTAGRGQVDWKLERPTFAPATWIFPQYPYVGIDAILKLLLPLGGEIREVPRGFGESWKWPGKFLFGDGGVMNYAVRLVLHPTRRREVVDQAVASLIKA